MNFKQNNKQNNKKNIEGSYIGNVKIINLDKETKKISTNFTTSFYKISNLDEHQILLEISGLDKNSNQTLIFFEDTLGYTSSSIFGRIDRIFFNSNNNLIHSWSGSSICTSTENSNNISSNGYVFLERVCSKCK